MSEYHFFFTKKLLSDRVKSLLQTIENYTLSNDVDRIGLTIDMH